MRRPAAWCPAALSEILAVACAVASVLALGALGCATLPPCPAKGGPAWSELHSDNFRVRTDLDPVAAREAVRTLEEIRAAMLALVWPNAPVVPGRIEVVALRSRGELWTFLQGGADAVRIQARPFASTIVVGGVEGERGLTELKHELAHELSLRLVPYQPRWYSEGIAAYLETITVDRAHHTAQVGEVSEERVKALKRFDRMPAEELFATRELPADFELARFEASSWLLVHFLMNQHLEELVRFQRSLAHFTAPDAAWKEAFPILAGEALDDAVYRYTRGRYATFSIRLPAVSPTIRVGPLSDAQVHSLRAFLYLVAVAPGRGEQEAASRAEVAEALRQDPGALEALAVSFYGLTPVDAVATRKDLATRSTQAHPESWLAWVMKADASGLKAADALVALTRALMLATDQPEILSRLAFANASRGRWDRALAFSSRALDLRAPVGLLPLYWEALARTGDCRDAAFMTEVLAQSAAAPKSADFRRIWREKLNPICLAVPQPAPDATGPADPPALEVHP